MNETFIGLDWSETSSCTMIIFGSFDENGVHHIDEIVEYKNGQPIEDAEWEDLTGKD